MVGHSELHIYFKFVYLYLMKMFVFRGLLIETGSNFWVPSVSWKGTVFSIRQATNIVHVISLTLHASFVYLSISQKI